MNACVETKSGFTPFLFEYIRTHPCGQVHTRVMYRTYTHTFVFVSAFLMAEGVHKGYLQR